MNGFGNPYKLKKLRYRMPLYRVGYCAVVGDTAFSEDYCELETYVYKIWKILPNGQISSDSLWIPHRPDSTYFTYSILAKVKQTPMSITDEPLPQNFSIEAFPNPGERTIHLSIRHEEQAWVSVRMFDVLGREVKHVNDLSAFHEAGSFTKPMDVSGLIAGMYFLLVQFNDKAPVYKKLAVGR